MGTKNNIENTTSRPLDRSQRRDPRAAFDLSEHILSRQLKSAKKPPFHPALPPIDNITVIQAQLFDNTKLPPKKGSSDHVLKLFVHTKGWGIDLRTPDWWRTIPLICPKLVLGWATSKHAEGGMTDEQFATYKGVAEPAIKNLDDPAFSLVRMGHILSSPGNQYYVGQFVYVAVEADGQAKVLLFANGDGCDLGPSAKSRSRTRLPEPGLPVAVFLYDPANLLAKQHAEKAALKARHDAGLGASHGL